MKPDSTTLQAPAIPRYLAMADRLRQRIEQGEWQAGALLPSLHELAREFGVARLTARQAVQRLVAEGLLTSRRGEGTRVTGRAEPLHTAPLETSLWELGQDIRHLKPQILEVDEAPRELPGGQPGRPEGYVYMRRLHYSEGRPYCVIALYMLQPVFARAPRRYRRQAVIPLMLEDARVRIAQAGQVLTLGSADAETAALLKVPAGSPVARVVRTFRDQDGAVLYYSEIAYRGDLVRLEIDLLP